MTGPLLALNRWMRRKLVVIPKSAEIVFIDEVRYTIPDNPSVGQIVVPTINQQFGPFRNQLALHLVGFSTAQLVIQRNCLAHIFSFHFAAWHGKDC